MPVVLAAITQVLYLDEAVCITALNCVISETENLHSLSSETSSSRPGRILQQTRTNLSHKLGSSLLDNSMQHNNMSMGKSSQNRKIILSL